MKFLATRRCRISLLILAAVLLAACAPATPAPTPAPEDAPPPQAEAGCVVIWGVPVAPGVLEPANVEFAVVWKTEPIVMTSWNLSVTTPGGVVYPHTSQPGDTSTYIGVGVGPFSTEGTYHVALDYTTDETQCHFDTAFVIGPPSELPCTFVWNNPPAPGTQFPTSGIVKVIWNSEPRPKTWMLNVISPSGTPQNFDNIGGIAANTSQDLDMQAFGNEGGYWQLQAIGYIDGILCYGKTTYYIPDISAPKEPLPKDPQPAACTATRAQITACNSDPTYTWDDATCSCKYTGPK